MLSAKPIRKLLALTLTIALNGSVFAWTYQAVDYQPNLDERSGLLGTLKSYKQLQYLKTIGVNTLMFSPSAYQPNLGLPELTVDSALSVGMQKDISNAKKLGFMLILRPVIESNIDENSLSLRETVSMRSEEEWRRWFANYERIIVHFAAIAQRLNVDVFVIGNEVERATRNHDAQWRRIARNVRAVYPGKITYAARGIEEAQRIEFWNDLDYIGINAGFRLSSSTTPTPEELLHTWASLRTDLGLLAKQNGDKPVLLTQLGYYGVDGTSQRPMSVPGPSAVEDRKEQADCFEAALSTLQPLSWIEGVVVWKYKVSVTPAAKSRTPSDNYAVFQKTLSEDVIKRHFQSAKP